MTVKYQCDVCKRLHSSEELARKCENEHPKIIDIRQIGEKRFPTSLEVTFDMGRTKDNIITARFKFDNIIQINNK